MIKAKNFKNTVRDQLNQLNNLQSWLLMKIIYLNDAAIFTAFNIP